MLKGTQDWRRKLAWKCRKYFNFQEWYGCSINQQNFCFQGELLRQNHTGLLSTIEEQTKVGLWCIWYFWNSCQPCSWDHWYGLPSTKGHCSLLSFHDFQMLIFNRLDSQLTEKLLRIYFLYSISIDSSCNVSLPCAPFKLPRKDYEDCAPNEEQHWVRIQTGLHMTSYE